MTLPFSHDDFLAAFAAYNRHFWPVATLLWLLTIAAILRLWQLGPRASRIVAILLAAHWAWSGLAYHAVFFRPINPVATVFAALFALQALLFLWLGVIKARLIFVPTRSPWGLLALLLIAYSFSYPLLNVLLGFSYPFMPTYGLPCPSTLLTAGLLLMLSRRSSRLVFVVPLVWTLVGGSGAILLDIPTDFALPIAGALLLCHLYRFHLPRLDVLERERLEVRYANPRHE